jgi:hypothetical protein
MNHTQSMMDEQQGDVMKKSSPSWAIILLALFLLLMLIASNIFSLSSAIQSGNTTNTILFSFEIYILVALFIFVVMTLLTSRKMEPKRQAAAQGDVRLLAEEQPAEDISAVLPPFTIRVRMNQRGFAAFTGVLLLFMALFICADFIFVYAISLLWIGVGLLIVAGCVGGVVFMNRLFPNRNQEITATAHGLMKKSGVVVEQIAWSDVRLFAIDSAFGLGKYPYPLLFKLAGKDQVLIFYWTHKYSGGLFIPMTKPVGSYEEYDRQMRMLLTIIACQTGLPLYDIRK